MKNSAGMHPHFARAALSPEAVKGAFYSEFQRSLRQCLLHGFSVEECFGVIWEETLETIRLEDTQHAQVYEDLIAWARHCREEKPSWTCLPRSTRRWA